MVGDPQGSLKYSGAACHEPGDKSVGSLSMEYETSSKSTHESYQGLLAG